MAVQTLCIRGIIRLRNCWGAVVGQSTQQPVLALREGGHLFWRGDCFAPALVASRYAAGARRERFEFHHHHQVVQLIDNRFGLRHRETLKRETLVRKRHESVGSESED